MVRGQKTKGLDQSKEGGGGGREIKTKEKSLETGEGSES